jgi:hypothetical protein
LSIITILLGNLYSPGEFYSHEYCYLWNKALVWLNVVSDALIAITYFAISIILMWFIRKRGDLPFSRRFAVFGVSIVACGSTHLREVWNLWHAQYWLQGAIKAIRPRVCRSAVRRISAASRCNRIPGNWRRIGQCATHHPKTRGKNLGGGHRRERCSVLPYLG